MIDQNSENNILKNDNAETKNKKITYNLYYKIKINNNV